MAHSIRFGGVGAIVLAMVATPCLATAQGNDAPPPPAAQPSATASSAEPPSPPPAEPPAEPENLTRAKELFRQGVALFEAGEMDRALDLFRRSRAQYPSAKNTINAALCLDKLNRFDEALEMYEEAIARHPEELDEEDKAGVRTAMATLRSKVGNLTISYNVPGNVVVDGRPRGTLPLTTPLRVMPGRHLVRVLKDGYATYETTVNIEPGSTAAIDARLVALAASGGLRVEDPSTPGADVVVDGAVVGASPWEGMLAPGTHVVQSRMQDRVSRLAKAVIVQGQTTLLRLASAPAGPVLYVDVEPPSAELSVDGVPLGKGRWEGTLPAGTYSVSAREEGYFSADQQVKIQDRAGPAQRFKLRLRVDEAHPRWPKRPTGHVWLSGYGGLGIGPSLGSGPESDCRGGCPSGKLAWGLTGGARIGYELPWRLSFEVTAGYATLWSKPERSVSATYGDAGEEQTVVYSFEDIVRLKGPMLAAGASYPIPIATGWSLRGRAMFGLIFASSVDAVKAKVKSSVDELPAGIQGAGESVRSTPLFVMPEVGAERTEGPFRLGASLGLLIVPQSGPELPQGTVSVSPTECQANPASAACAPEAALLRGERAFGPFVMFVPTVSAAYVF